MRCAALLLLLAGGCIVIHRPPPSTPAPSPPGTPPPAPAEPRIVASVGPQLGFLVPSDSGDDGATGPGVGFGLHGHVGFRVAPGITIGPRLYAAVSSHDTPDPDLDVSYWLATLSPEVRVTLERSTLDLWGGWYAGNRAFSDGKGPFGEGSDRISGLGLGAAWLWRVRLPRGPQLELGPYAHTAWARVAEDEASPGTGAGRITVRTFAVGVAWHAYFALSD